MPLHKLSELFESILVTGLGIGSRERPARNRSTSCAISTGGCSRLKGFQLLVLLLDARGERRLRGNWHDQLLLSHEVVV